MQSIRIVSDGIFPKKIKVYSEETGEEIKGVRKIEFQIGVGEIAIAKLSFAVSHLDVAGLVDVTELGDEWRSYRLDKQDVSMAE